MNYKKFILLILAVFSGVEYIICFMLKKERHELKKDLQRMQKLFSVANRWLMLEINGENLGKIIEKRGYTSVAVYGMGELGIRIIEDLKMNTSIHVLYGLDRNAERISTYIPVYKLEDIKGKMPDLIIIAAYCKDSSLKDKICDFVDCDVISIEELING